MEGDKLHGQILGLVIITSCSSCKYFIETNKKISTYYKSIWLFCRSVKMKILSNSLLANGMIVAYILTYHLHKSK